MRSAFNMVMHGAILLPLLVFVGGAAAADGQIDLVGKVINSTCTINAGVPNFQVTLPTVSVQSLKVADAVAGRTRFEIRFTECTVKSASLGVFFEPGSNINLSTSRLRNSATANSNVEIQLLNGDFSVIRLAAARGLQNVTDINISATGTGAGVYYAQYYATGAAVPGDVKAFVQYSIVYP